MNKKLSLFIPFIVTLCVIFLFYIKRSAFLKFYPPACNLFLLAVFTASLFSKETVIQKAAKIMEGGRLTPAVSDYTRKLTCLWCIFIFFNFSVSLISVFMSDNFWMIYNGCISYILTGLLFLLEFSFRTFLKKRGRL